MPQRRAEVKSLRKNEVKRQRNRAERSALRTEIKKAKLAIEEKSEGLADQLSATAGWLDRAAQKHLIHRKKAARIKSQLARAAAAADS